MKTLIFLYGLLFGSFYNVVGLRVPKKESIIRPRSSCPHCDHVLAGLDLIPVLSYLLQRGKCRQCKQRISPLYPVMELVTACLFVGAYMKFGLSIDVFIAWSFLSLLIIITVSDIAYMIIPDKVLLFFTCIFIVFRIFQPLTPWWDSLLGAGVIFILMLGIAIISKGGLGGGDIKLFTVLGLLLGLKLILLTFFLANLIGAIFGIIGVLLGIFKRNKPIPFGPFIACGAIITYFFHESIFKWYGSFFNF